METIDIILIIAILIIYFDSRRRLNHHTRFLSLFVVTNDILSKTLLDKGIISKEELGKASKKYVDNLKIVNPENYKFYKKTLLEMGVDIDKEYKEPTLRNFIKEAEEGIQNEDKRT